MVNDPQPMPLDDVIASYLREEEAGRHLDREEWIRRHPGLADELRAFFRDHDGFRALAGRGASPRAGGTARIDLTRKAPSPRTGPPPRAAETAPNRFGDYELGEEIARGSMGIVHRARQVSLDRPVALKMMLESTFPNPEDVRRFEQEAKAAGRLDHPNIVPIYDVGCCRGRHYYAMRLVTGGDLGDVMDALRADPTRAARMMATIARAVDHAHQRGVLHRDLKPANILLDGDGVPHVADFGLAKRLDDAARLTMSGYVLGTAAYMSPEQAAGNARCVTAASDVYSLGAIFYEMLTGEPPFTGGSAMEVVLKVRAEEPVHPRVRNPAADRGLSTICLKCLEKQPEQRYASARTLAEDLEAWLAGQPIGARPPSAARRLVRWAGRHPVPVAMAVMVLVIAATAGVTLLLRPAGHRERPLVSQDPAGLGLKKSRTVDLAYALMERGKPDMARQLFREVLSDSKDPLEIMEAEEGLQKLAERDLARSKGAR